MNDRYPDEMPPLPVCLEYDVEPWWWEDLADEFMWHELMTMPLDDLPGACQGEGDKKHN